MTSVVRPAIPGPSGPLPLTEPHGPPRSGRTALVPNTGRLYVRAKAAFKGEYAIDASVTTDGNEAAARVAYRLSDVIAIYPITPASPMGELADGWSGAGVPNLWGCVPRVVEMQSEGGAAGVLHGAVTTAGLRDDLHGLPGAAAYAPQHVQDRRGTHADGHPRRVPDARHPRPVDLRRPQRRHGRQDHRLCDALLVVGAGRPDLALVAHAATLRSRVPFLHVFDGFRTSHGLNQIDQADDATIRAMIDEALGVTKPRPGTGT